MRDHGRSAGQVFGHLLLVGTLAGRVIGESDSPTRDPDPPFEHEDAGQKGNR